MREREKELSLQTLGEFVRWKRKGKLRYSQAEVSQIINMDEAYIRRLEAGKQAGSNSSLIAVAAALEESPSLLMALLADEIKLEEAKVISELGISVAVWKFVLEKAKETALIANTGEEGEVTGYTLNLSPELTPEDLDQITGLVGAVTDRRSFINDRSRDSSGNIVVVDSDQPTLASFAAGAETLRKQRERAARRSGGGQQAERQHHESGPQQQEYMQPVINPANGNG